MNVSQELKNLWAKVSGEEGDGMVSVQEFVDEQNAMAKATPKEVEAAIKDVKNAALRLGETPLGLRYYTEAKLMEGTAMPLVNETVAAEIEDQMIDVQRQAVSFVGAAMKKLVSKRQKQLEELRNTNKSLAKVTGGCKWMRKLFKKISGEQDKLFNTIGSVSFSFGPKLERKILENIADQWKMDLSRFNQNSLPDNQVKTDVAQ